MNIEAPASLLLHADSLESERPPFALGVRSSFAGRSWRMREVNSDAARELELMGLSASLAQVLASRGVKRETAAQFLDPRLRTQLPDPHRFTHMERAAERFVAAVARSETVAVLADYDVDGACAAALLIGYLRKLSREPLLYVPDRLTEGYGPSPAAMETLRQQGARLVVTVDCGAASHQALAAARERGLDVIVLDHHAVEENPPAFAHVNPNGPDDASGVTYVCAAGLTFLFLVAVQRILRLEGWFASQGLHEVDLMGELDLVALATVADVVPLHGANRAFVRQGLRKLETLARPGFAALARLASATPPFSAHHLGFMFGPRINAGGRVGRCDLGARLLASADAAEADTIALELDRHNRERQAIEAHILEAANAMALAQDDKPFLLLGGEGWHPGVVGIIAGRLKERYGRPALVAGFDGSDEQAIGRGSARSVKGLDLGAIIRAARAEGILETGGGHAMAAGFSVRRSRLGVFGEFLGVHIGPQRAVIRDANDLVIDALVSASGANHTLLDDLDRAGPYGAGHPEPTFVLPDMLVVYAGVVGAKHVRLRLVGRDGQGLGAIAFRICGSPLGDALLKARSSRIHVAGRLKRDEYEGEMRVQFHVEDAAPAEAPY